MTIPNVFRNAVRRLAGAGAASILATGVLAVADLTLPTPLAPIGTAEAQQSGSPGGSGNQGTSTGPGSTSRTSNQNRAGGGSGTGTGSGGGGAGGVPAGVTTTDTTTGGAQMGHGAGVTKLSQQWCGDVPADGVGDEARWSDRNLARLDAAAARATPAGTTLSRTIRSSLAAYQGQLESGDGGIRAAAVNLATAAMNEITPALVAEINAVLCVPSSAQRNARIAEMAKQMKGG